ncbi:carbohydrate-binding family 9-like protein [Snuella sedimenti]|uniref:Carbohydrate-binding family 9-like protein n=1 Tax=Snuella sedimenti TaxID=2798802 RepID=A0A8J7IF54_9FLAO|nr:carbohydrate-binding family 9-like protein [Snuella sedimenti]MBJ6367412.1 carbohydrate-binding family 9-like protein [Snuella sedimenti]
MDLKFKFLIIVSSISFAAYAQQKKEIIPQTYVAHKVSETIVIDGKADESSWKQAPWTNDFIDIEGVVKPTYQTQVKMLWDETYFYILAKMEEPHVWATLKQRDTIIFYNNDFEVFVDPDGDSFNYYELELNALNTVWDLFLTKPYRAGNVVLNDWDINGFKSAVHVDGTLNNPNDIDKGWTLEMAIPWSVYKTSYHHDVVPRDTFWRVNFSRVNWDHQITNGTYERKKDANGKHLHEYNWVWSPIGVINMHEPENWGYVYFSSKGLEAQVDFTIPNDEKIKWELFKLYRAQRSYYASNKKRATTIKDINPLAIIVEGVEIKPVLENHSFGWTISVKSPFTNDLLIIKEDGAFSKRK